MTDIRVQALVANGTDAAQIEYSLQRINCKTREVVGAPEVARRPLEDQVLPGNLEELQDKPLASDSSHAFADLFLVVEPGCYDVTTTPLDASGAPSERCASAFKRKVKATEGQTTEVFLINQCEGHDPAALDIVSALNQEPVLEDVWFEESKFSCGSPAEVCASGSDPEYDPLEFELVLPAESACTVDALASRDEGTQCWKLDCPEWGKHDFEIRVYDLLRTEAGSTRVEDWLAAEGYPNDSHAELSLYAYFDGVPVYPDTDGDGYGDASGVELVCEEDDIPAGFVLDAGDCNDTDADINPGAEEVCDQVDNDCDGTADDPTCTGPDPECVGQVCGTFTTCNEGGSCGSSGVCGSTADGGGLCVDGGTPCAGLARCFGGQTDCTDEAVCVVQSCCGDPVCVPKDRFCSDSGSPSARPLAPVDGPTVGSL